MIKKFFYLLVLSLSHLHTAAALDARDEGEYVLLHKQTHACTNALLPPRWSMDDGWSHPA